MATATARLSSTTGVGTISLSRLYRTAISCQSVSPALRACAWQAAIAACNW